MQTLLTAGQGSNLLHRSVKSQVCELVRTIVQSLADIARIFSTRTGKDGKMCEFVVISSSLLVEN